MQLEQEFNQAMFKIYYSAKEIGYTASKFFQMLEQHGGLQTARNLINASTISSGYTRLWELKRLDLSVEASFMRTQNGTRYLLRKNSKGVVSDCLNLVTSINGKVYTRS